MAQAGLAVAVAGTGLLGVFALPAGAPHITQHGHAVVIEANTGRPLAAFQLCDVSP